MSAPFVSGVLDPNQDTLIPSQTSICLFNSFASSENHLKFPTVVQGKANIALFTHLFSFKEQGINPRDGDLYAYITEKDSPVNFGTVLSGVIKGIRLTPIRFEPGVVDVTLTVTITSDKGKEVIVTPSSTLYKLTMRVRELRKKEGYKFVCVQVKEQEVPEYLRNL